VHLGVKKQVAYLHP